MPRITPVEAPYTPEFQADVERVMPPGVPPLVLFTTLAQSPRAWQKFRDGSLLDGRLLTLRERELVICRTCARSGCEYEWGVHVSAFGSAAKLSRDDVAATLALPLERERWSEREAALLSAVDALHERSTLSPEEFALLRAHFDEQQLLEILMLAGFYRTVSYLCNGLALPLERTAARFAEFGA